LKVKIYSIHFNRPDFVEFQDLTLRSFLKDDYELIIVNNANDSNLIEGISKKCRDLNLSEYKIEGNIDQQAASQYPGYHHAIAMNDVMQNLIKYDEGISVILDGDVFLLNEYSFNERMQNVEMLGAYQHRKGRYWLTPVVLAFKPDKLLDFEQINLIGSHIVNLTPDNLENDVGFFPKRHDNHYIFDCPVCAGSQNIDQNSHICLDTGGELYTYLRNHKNSKVARASNTHHLTRDSLECIPEKYHIRYKDEYAFEFYANKFLHYCRSSNWDHKTNHYHSLKTSLLIDMINDAINREVYFDAKYQKPNDEIHGWPDHAINHHEIK